MTNYKSLEKIYKQNLEDDIIQRISQIKNIDIRSAMSIYYSSQLSKQIENSTYGIENLSPYYLAEDLIENEPELFKKY